MTDKQRIKELEAELEKLETEVKKLKEGNKIKDIKIENLN